MDLVDLGRFAPLQRIAQRKHVASARADDGNPCPMLLGEGGQQGQHRDQVFAPGARRADPADPGGRIGTGRTRGPVCFGVDHGRHELDMRRTSRLRAIGKIFVAG